MCLYVREVPASPKNAIVVKTKKDLCRDILLYEDSSFRTPYLNYKVPSNGLIINHKKYSLKNIFYDDRITGHCVHSYYRKPIFSCNLYTSYAIGVIAYGIYKDVGSIALYIPNADVDSTPKMKTEILKYLKGKNHKMSDIFNFFPKLKNRIDCFKAIGIEV
jgi:hypothetical protein